MNLPEVGSFLKESSGFLKSLFDNAFKSAAFLFAFMIVATSIQTCATLPRVIKGSPIICQQADQWVYMATANQPIFGKRERILNDSVTTDGVETCRDQLNMLFCFDRKEEYMKNHPIMTKKDHPDYKYWNSENEKRADRIFEQCMANQRR